MSTTDTTAPPARKDPDRVFFGHPRGLGYLSITEGWVGFSYYGMQSLLVLYMVGQLLKPGHIEHILGFGAFRVALQGLYGPLAGQPLASAITGLYGAFAYGTPVLGGLIADRWLGRTRCVMLGCILMTLGHFLMAFEASFLLALLCLVCGTGLAGNLKAQVGGLYGPSDTRRADAFQLFLAIYSAAVIFSPLVCGALGEKVAWHWGFGAAGVGMLIGLVIYLSGLKWLPPEPAIVRKGDAERVPLTRRDWKVMAILALLIPIIAVAMLGNMEIFNGYLLWGQANFQLVFFGQTMPVSWLLSIDAFVSVITIGLSITFWRWWASRWTAPSEITKLAIGTTIAALAPLLLAMASVQAASGHKVGLAWGLSFHIINDIGFANIYAVGMALFSRAAPKALGATVIGAYTLTVFIANLMVGKLAGLLSTMPGASFWLLHAVLIAGAAVAMATAARLFHRALAPESGAATEA